MLVINWRTDPLKNLQLLCDRFSHQKRGFPWLILRCRSSGSPGGGWEGCYHNYNFTGDSFIFFFSFVHFSLSLSLSLFLSLSLSLFLSFSMTNTHVRLHTHTTPHTYTSSSLSLSLSLSLTHTHTTLNWVASFQCTQTHTYVTSLGNTYLQNRTRLSLYIYMNIYM